MGGWVPHVVAREALPPIIEAAGSTRLIPLQIRLQVLRNLLIHRGPLVPLNVVVMAIDRPHCRPVATWSACVHHALVWHGLPPFLVVRQGLLALAFVLRV